MAFPGRLPFGITWAGTGKAVAGAASIGLAFASPASAQERWEATSTTATAITGNATFSPDRIRLHHGKSLPLEEAGRLAGLEASGFRGPAVVYRVTSPENPVLLRRNRLCGDEPPTYIAVLSVPRAGGRPARSLGVFTSAAAPRADSQPCAVYNYELAGGRLAERPPQAGTPGNRRQAARPEPPAASMIRPGAITEVPETLAELGWDTDLPALLVIRYLPQRTSFAPGWDSWVLSSYFHFTGMMQTAQPDPWPPFFTAESRRSGRGPVGRKLTPAELQAFQEWCFKRAAVVPHVIVHSIPYVMPAPASAEIRILPLGLLPGTPREDQHVEGVGFAMVILLAVERSADDYGVVLPPDVAASLPRAGLRLETRVRWTEPRRADGYLTFAGEPTSIRIVQGDRALWEHRFQENGAP